MLVLTMGVRRGGNTGICLPLEIGTKQQKFLEIRKFIYHYLG